MDEKIHIVCPHCNGTNRIPKGATKASCGRCKASLLDTKPINLNGDNFNQHIEKNDIPVVVDFWANWCGPCKMMAPSFAQAADSFVGTARFAKLDTEAHQNIAASYNIRSIPTMILFKGGREVDRVSGALDVNAIRQWVARYA
ncbi:MAG: hypothetical protein KU37_09895 [Sulfuricurvum sp. PC08-66]|nr:MAG: hypothetical protein KU37_09895 [Sulfuricurvum sp. PC08-66]